MLAILFSSVLLNAQLKADDSYLLKLTNSQNYLPLGSSSNDEIVDLAVLYQGGVERLEFTRQEIIPYVYRWTSNGDLEWLFDGFLFHEDRTFDGYAFEQEAFRYQKNRARKSEWIWLINRIFEPAKSIHVLNQVIDEQSKIGNVPKRKRKVIISLPEPLSGQLDWGELNGKNLDFARDEDRIEAVKWYVDELIRNFNEGNFQHLELSGFYWLRQDNELTFQLMPQIAAYIKSEGYKFYWRPQYQKHRGKTWRINGFDAAYLQPNYFLNSDFNKLSLEKACTYASLYNMGLEVDIESAITNATHQSKFTEYMEVFTNKKVFEKAAMSFSDGGKTFYELSKTTTPALQNIFKIITNYVAERQKRTDENIHSDVKQTSLNNEKSLEVNYHSGSDELIINSQFPFQQLSVYSLDGSLVSEKFYLKDNIVNQDSLFMNREKGFYIVRLITTNKLIFSRKFIIACFS